MNTTPEQPARLLPAPEDEAHTRRVLALALGNGAQTPRPHKAWALLKSRRPASLALDLVLGDLDAVQRTLAGADISALLPPLQTPALALAAGSSLARIDALRPGLVATVKWLLQQGADPNTRWADPVRPQEQLPVLYSAVSRAGCVDTVQALLEAGADPNDQESLYHATEQADRRIIEALVLAGARWQRTNALYRQLDHDNLAHLRQVLDLGADVHEPGPDGGGPLHHAIARGRGTPFVALLLAHGADPLLRNGHGDTPAELAASLGDTDTLALLEAQGRSSAEKPEEKPERDPTRAFLNACAAADAPAACAHLRVQPDAVQRLGPALRLLPDQAQRGRMDSVRLMLELGWPVSVPGNWQASALNQAAFRGDAAMVRLLLKHGARWHEPNGYGGNALGSCLHAGINEPDPAGEYAEVLQLLLDDGAPPPEPDDAWPDAMVAVMQARLAHLQSRTSPGP